MGGNLSLEKKLFEQTISKTGFGDHLRQSSHRQLNVKQLKKKKRDVIAFQKINFHQ